MFTVLERISPGCGQGIDKRCKTGIIILKMWALPVGGVPQVLHEVTAELYEGTAVTSSFCRLPGEPG